MRTELISEEAVGEKACAVEGIVAGGTLGKEASDGSGDLRVLDLS